MRNIFSPCRVTFIRLMVDSPALRLLTANPSLNSLFANCCLVKISQSNRLCCIDCILSAGCTASLHCARHLPGVSARTQTHPHMHAATLNAFIDLSSNLVATLTFGAHGNQVCSVLTLQVNQFSCQSHTNMAHCGPPSLMLIIFIWERMSHICLSLYFRKMGWTPTGLSWQRAENVSPPFITSSTGTWSKCSSL